MWDGAGPLRVGMITHLPLPHGTAERPAGAGAGVAASSREGSPGPNCWWFLYALFKPLGEEGGAGGLCDPVSALVLWCFIL